MTRQKKKKKIDDVNYNIKEIIFFYYFKIILRSLMYATLCMYKIIYIYIPNSSYLFLFSFLIKLEIPHITFIKN